MFLPLLPAEVPMGAENSCPECGAILPQDAPNGFCPACLVLVGAGWEAAEKVEGKSRKEEGVSAGFPAGATGREHPEDSALGSGALPALFGGYELLSEIGRGGMGVVYKARQIALNRTVALKMPLHGQFAAADFIDRFRLEAEAAAHLDHPNIVPIYEVGVHQGQAYYSMKLIEGRSLGREIAEGRWKRGTVGTDDDHATEQNRQRSVATLVSRLAQAVRYAHERGVLHRDIKPQNILVDIAGQPHLTDFGLAKLMDQEGGLTLGSGIIGSPEFMAPEQAAGKNRQVTTAVDVYGLGAVLYVLLTGRTVFHAETPLETVRQVIEQEPARPRGLNPAVERDLETICLKCLQKEPAKRYASAQALAEDLNNWLEAKPIQARRVTDAERLWLWCRRQPLRAGLAGALILSVALGLTGMLWALRRATAGELLARQTAYAAEMNLAQRAMVGNEFDRTVTLVKRYRPLLNSEADLRNWEWRYLWQWCQGDRPRVVHQDSPIQVMAVSRDGKLLALARQTGASVRNLAGNQLLAELPDKAYALTFAPTGGVLALSTRNAAKQPIIKLWDVYANQQRNLFTNGAPFKYLAFSPDSSLLACSDISGDIRVVEVASGHVVARTALETPRRPETGGVAFLPDGRRLAIGGDLGNLLVWDWQSGQSIKLATTKTDGVTALAASPQGDLLAAGFGYTDGTIELWNPNTRELLGKLTNHTAWTDDLAFTPDGARLVSRGEDKTIRVFNMADRSEYRCFRTCGFELSGIAVLPDGYAIISGGYDGAVCLWDSSAPFQNPGYSSLVIAHGVQFQTEAGNKNKEPSPKVIRRFGVAFTPDSQHAITTSPDGALSLREVRSLKVVRPLPELGSNNWGVAMSPAGNWLAVGKVSGTIEIWDWKTPRVVARLVMPPFQWVGFMRFSQTGRYLLAYSTVNDWTTDFRIWETNRWSEIPAGHVHSSGLLKGDVSPDERLIAMSYPGCRVQICRFPSGKPLYSFTNNFGSFALLFSPDSRLLALGAGNGPVVLWDVQKRREFARLPGHFLATWGIAFSPDGRRLLTAGRQARDAVKLWDLATQSELLVFPAEGQMFWDVRFSPDGNTLVANSFGGLAHFWHAPSLAEIKAAEKGQLP